MTKPGAREARALAWSTAVGVLVLALKLWAYARTSSIAVLGDLLESWVQLAAVGFAYFAIRYAQRPPDERHHFGFDKITYFSAIIEGTLILATGVGVIFEASRKWSEGEIISRGLNTGLVLMSATAVLNGFMGTYLVRLGRERNSLAVTANGRHLLSDLLTTVGAIVGLALVKATGWLWMDSATAIVLASIIIMEGGKIVHEAYGGLMDAANPSLEKKVLSLLNELAGREVFRFHRLRLRESGTTVHVDFHIQVPNAMSIGRAHTLATQVEREVVKTIGRPCDITSHLEPFDIPESERDPLDP